MQSTTQRRLRIFGAIFCASLIIILGAFAWLWSQFRDTVPVIEGHQTLVGLKNSVTIERDAAGIPTLRGNHREDLAHALGYVHGQDRFFQMDLSRRRASGELAELFGPAALPLDRGARAHELRALSQLRFKELPIRERQLLEAYAAGVNAAIANAEKRPWEYAVLRSSPRLWLPEDSVLCIFAMALDLQDVSGGYERTLMTLRDQLGTTGLAFFAPLIGPADAALDGSTAPLPEPPGPRVIDLRVQRKVPTANTVFLQNRPAPISPWQADELAAQDLESKLGSNAFGIAGKAPGSPATLENDMHLTLSAPGVWYRARLVWTEAAASPKNHDITGVTLPGTPAIVTGSNGSIAWGFTNSYADSSDLVLVQVDEVTPESLYISSGKVLEFEERRQTIHVKGEKDEELITRWTIWGPIIAEAPGKRPLAFKWALREPGAVNLTLMELETAQTADDAIAVAHRSGIPAQNFFVADKNGALIWTIAGKLPKRIGHAGRLPISWAYGDRSWDGFVPSQEIPVYRARPGEALWSANQRMLGGDALSVLGDGGYDWSARAGRLSDRAQQLVATASRQPLAPPDFLAVALDDRAEYLDRWQKKALDTLTAGATQGHPARAEFRRLIENWQGRATVDSVSYRLVRTWRQRVASRVMDPIFARCREVWGGFNFRALPYEQPLWALLEQQPMHILEAEYPTWDDLLLAAIDDVTTSIQKGGGSLSKATWGELNQITIRHPFSRVVPDWVAKMIDMPTQPLPGDSGMPRVQTLKDGSSQRSVITPGQEKDAVFHMPAGQSGHPLSPYYRAGHQDWAQGNPPPFLPGPPQHTLTLTPSS
ncbi:MAG TPA: penicillin acylase family protein [Opitutaceae bacterium]|nr:penicillin acylase family protein [Opitutaceae bacterium]